MKFWLPVGCWLWVFYRRIPTVFGACFLCWSDFPENTSPTPSLMAVEGWLLQLSGKVIWGFNSQHPCACCLISFALSFVSTLINCTLCPRDALLFFTFFILGNKPQEFYGGRKSCIMGQERMASSDLILTQLHPNPLFPFRSSCPSLLPPAPCSSELPGTSIFFILLKILWYYLCGY